LARNVEIKARVADLARVEERARAVATGDPVDLVQDDTFFHCASGRLKLRDFGDGRAELIHYSRPDQAGPKLSEYLLSPVAAPALLREALARAYGILGRVVKRRRLYLADRTRIHLDRVDGLGEFVELEVVLDDAETPEDGNTVARELMGRLGIGDGQLVSGAYIDLLQSCTK
jgi:predicted adenylyl cyclase CyaB